MEKNDSGNRYHELAKKWLDGTLTNEEAEEYANWYNAGQEEPLHIPASFATDRETHRKRMLHKIDAGIDATTEYRYRRVWFAAAAALLLLLVGAWWFLVRQQASVQKAPAVVKEQDIAPGRNGAILVLANGSQILLDSVANGALAQQGSTQIMKANGAITYQSKAGDTSQTLFYNTMITPKGKQFQLTLPDGTKVWLNAASSIRYPAAFSLAERRVELTGEGYFEVARDAARPFYVTVRDMEVAVLGTHFNIMAYTNEQDLRTSLLEGAVRISHRGSIKKLVPGQQAIVDLRQNDMRIVTTDTEASIAWKEGYFRFSQSDIPAIMRQLERWYNIDIRFEGTIPDRRFGGEISRHLPLSGMIDFLQKAGIHVKRTGSTLTVSP